MAKQVKQFRFYEHNSDKNYPNGSSGKVAISYRNLTSGSIFLDYMPIIQLGIQALPGTQFYLNGSQIPVIIGHTGIYELNLDGLSEITSLKFDPKSIEAINGNANSYLIVDIIYEEEDVK